MEFDGKPIFDYRQIIKDSGDPGYVNRVMLGTACTGLVRIEWSVSKSSAIMPHNWAMVQTTQAIPSFYPLRWQVDDAQNLIVKTAIDREFEWLILLEHDVIIPGYFFLKLNQYILRELVPVVSGLYFTRSFPSDPLLYRGRGVGHYTDWQLGEKVWVDGVPTGALLIHMGVIREMWKDSEEYQPMGTNVVTRRVFRTPRDIWYDPDTNQINATAGTSDLDWCTRLIQGDYIRKAGWTKFWDKLPDQKYPLLVDTTLFCQHINPDGSQFPINWQELKLACEYMAANEFKKPSVVPPDLPEINEALAELSYERAKESEAGIGKDRSGVMGVKEKVSADGSAAPGPDPGTWRLTGVEPGTGRLLRRRRYPGFDCGGAGDLPVYLSSTFGRSGCGND